MSKEEVFEELLAAYHEVLDYLSDITRQTDDQILEEINSYKNRFYEEQ